jgi:hypothetical protein
LLRRELGRAALAGFARCARRPVAERDIAVLDLAFTGE